MSQTFYARFLYVVMIHQNFYLKNCTYLDDIFIGDASPEKVKQELKNLIWVLQEGDFPPQKIVANNISILRDLDESQNTSVSSEDTAGLG